MSNKKQDQATNIMKSSKTYVVFHGRKPGACKTWIDCYAQVSAFKDSDVRLYDDFEEGNFAWTSYKQSPTSSMFKKSEIDN